VISITSKLFDLLGHLEIEPLPGESEGGISRRVSRVATLNQGVAVNDGGFSHGDRTLIYRYKPVSKDHDNRARRLVELHSRVYVSNADGVFECVPESFDPGADSNTITLFVILKVSED